MLPTLFRRGRRWPEPIEAIRREVEEAFDRALMPWWGGIGETEELTAAYPVDIREAGGEILVDAEMPGFKKDEIQVTLEQGMLRIVGEHKEKTKEKKEAKAKGQTHLRERRYTRVERSFTLPGAVDESKVDARLEDGVLHLKLRKTKESQPRKIDVK